MSDWYKFAARLITIPYFKSNTHFDNMVSQFSELQN